MFSNCERVGLLTVAFSFHKTCQSSLLVLQISLFLIAIFEIWFLWTVLTWYYRSMSKIWNSLSIFFPVVDLNMHMISFKVIVAYSVLFLRVDQNSMGFTWSPYYPAERQKHQEKYETVRNVSTTDLISNREGNFLKHDNTPLKIKLIKWGSRVQHNDMKILTHLKGLCVVIFIRGLQFCIPLYQAWKFPYFSVLWGKHRL